MSQPIKAVLQRPLLSLGLGLILTGCAATGTSPTAPEPAPTSQAEEIKAAEAPVVYGNFRKDTLYDLLTAEIAGQRNRYDVALGNYLLQAEQTRDPGVVERAMRVAEFLGAHRPALDMAMLWTDVDPQNPDAFRSAALHLARAGQHEEAMQAMQTVLAMQGETHFDFLALAAAQSDSHTRKALLHSIERLVAANPENAQLLFANALLLQQDEREDEALVLLNRNPVAASAPQALMLHSRLLAADGQTDEAISLLQEGLRQSPDDSRMRLLLARLLVSEGELDAAAAQFTLLTQHNPDDLDLLLSLALINLEGEQFAAAAEHFERLLDADPNNDTARYHLGIAYQQLDQPEKALEAWQGVQGERDFLTSRLRISQLMADQGRVDELATRLEADRAARPDAALQLYLIEIESLAPSNPALAMQRANDALQRYEFDSNLLYTRAMLAEKVGQPEQLKVDLRTIIEREPENSMALNALGYTLADRNESLDEALQLIEKAAALNPDDPAITDSLGWVHYRLGNLELAEEYLRKAYTAYPDPEVAAHLGEVLWAQGKHREARKIWDKSLKADPENDIVPATRQRLESH
ncbi:tetratricopeptide repeat protein [Halopseudomonas pelagia]|uniref:tetratricopeptide repeat protein n=1 Tax=Halopseudomonas pelagia TaxID=553151 RepID=UPI0003A6CF5A|nr:tetratricopeptide repeat protein [Halopseudomonas pelagia]|tara:strand:- start:208 stop:1953 length:1746 start_codon:yes stop_codon:yes gene_type:complete